MTEKDGASSVRVVIKTLGKLLTNKMQEVVLIELKTIKQAQ